MFTNYIEPILKVKHDSNCDVYNNQFCMRTPSVNILQFSIYNQYCIELVSDSSYNHCTEWGTTGETSTYIDRGYKSNHL